MPKISIIFPCRDEEKTIGRCIEKAEEALQKNGYDGEIIVSDSSRDKSPEIAALMGAKVVKHGRKGYGIACLEGMKNATGDYIIIADSDGTYDVSELPLIVDRLSEGCDLVIGTRLKGDIKKDAMKPLHRYIGNPFLSSLLNFLFRTNISDAHCGFRGIRKEALAKLNLRTTGMEFASEMVILSAKNRLSISEVPISYHPRLGVSKLSSFSDGWRHLRFMLLYSPTHLFLIPGMWLFFLGLFIMVPLLFGSFLVNGIDATPIAMFIGALMTILGFQVSTLGFYARIYAIHTGFEKSDRLIDFIAESMPLERGIVLSIIIVLIGVLAGGQFLSGLFSGEAASNSTFFLFAMAILSIGFQAFFAVFFISIMLIEKND